MQVLKGEDGFSPIVDTQETKNGYLVIITDKENTNSFEIKNGERGEVGPQGVQGPVGPQGIQGPIGPVGSQGIQGPRGEKGDKGDKGDPGRDGKDGINGRDGVNGRDGINGKDGKDGISPTHYWQGSTLYITSASGTSSANLKGEPGEQGPQGV
jgi:hypothetical protein